MSAQPGTVPNPSAPTSATFRQHKVRVLLVDDQPMIGEAVRRMLAPEADIEFHYCSDPTQAIAQANEITPTVILQDLVMPQLDGLTLVKFTRANQATRETPLIVLSTKEEAKVKAEAFALGANDYLVKLPDRIELVARIRYHSKGYINLLQRNEAYEALAASRKILADDVDRAAKYVLSLLPKNLAGKVDTDWRYVPSTELAGDTFGYHWLDDEHFAAYLLDVCGHGVGAALLSVSALNVLRSQSLPNVDFRHPSEVLAGLNEAFKMEEQNDMYFTIWYGVYNPTQRQITFSGGGHPPALLLTGPSPAEVKLQTLEAQGPMIGAFEGQQFESLTVPVGTAAKLFIFSDGVYEIGKPDGNMWDWDDFLALMSKPSDPDVQDMDRLLEYVRKLHGNSTLDDDFTIIEARFNP